MRFFIFLISFTFLTTNISQAEKSCRRFNALHDDQIFSLCDVKEFTIVAFWSAKCIPCLKEADILYYYSKQHPELPIKIISIDDHNNTTKYFSHSKTYMGKKMKGDITVFIANDNTSSLFKEVGNDYSLLPFVIAVTAGGDICKKRNGLLGTKTIDNWKTQCSQSHN